MESLGRRVLESLRRRVLESMSRWVRGMNDSLYFPFAEELLDLDGPTGEEFSQLVTHEKPPEARSIGHEPYSWICSSLT